ncbi:oxidoreductase [Aureococcus anophagefferens]|nr:oxidoreductase [Aureococcus anophagefferens]
MGIGCNKWGTDPAKFDAGALEATYVAALDAGVTLFNTAQAYPTSEACLGGLRARTRRPAFVVSKFNSLAAAPQALVASLRASLDALGAAKVDGFLVHFPRRPRGAADGLAAAVGAGLVDHVGCSNFGERALRRLHGLLGERGVPLRFNEVEFSLLRRKPEADGLLACCAELGVTVLAWAPLASGRLGASHANDVANPKARPLLRELEVVAEKTGRTTTQVALNWCICKGVVPIPARAHEGAGGGELRRRELPAEQGRVVALSAPLTARLLPDPTRSGFLGLRPPRL